jgi:hypothetical protein
VVDPGPWPAGQTDVVQDLEAVGTQQLQGRSDELRSLLIMVQLTLCQQPRFQLPYATSGVHRAPVLVEVT